jgi:hypothetical protein
LGDEHLDFREGEEAPSSRATELKAKQRARKGDGTLPDRRLQKQRKLTADLLGGQLKRRKELADYLARGSAATRRGIYCDDGEKPGEPPDQPETIPLKVG